MLTQIPGLISRLIESGVSEEDDEQARLRTTTTTLVLLVVCLLTPIWVVTYLALGRPLSAAIPGVYLIFTCSLCSGSPRSPDVSLPKTARSR
jgi:hypothetical protein